jgi:hypothetical protein
VPLLGSACAAADPERAAGEDPGEGGPRINLFLDGLGSLDALLRTLDQPDFVLLKGDEYRKLSRRAGTSATGAAGESAAVVDRVAVTGTIRADRADLVVEYGVTLRLPGPAVVPIRLDEQMVTSAREGELDVPLTVINGGWHVELRGAGLHRIAVELRVPLRATVEGHRIDLAIPEAASTRFAWDVNDRVTDAATGGGDLVEVEPISGPGRGSGAPAPAPARGPPAADRGSRWTRLSAHLTPRARLDVHWRVEADPEGQLPPLLTMQGEIAIDVDPGTFRTRSTWAVHAVRGTTQRLEFRLDPADEVLELELDGQPVRAGIERQDGSAVLSIALADPLRPGLAKSLVMTTRRTIARATAASPPLLFGGFALINAREQSGAIGIAQSGNLWVGGIPGRGLRRIDPRTELPPDLRTRPATTLAYAFADQPFELGLRIEPSPPLVRTESRSTLMLDARAAHLDTWIDYQPAHGRLFDLSLGLPDGLELESAGPREVVEAAQHDAAATSGTGGRRTVILRLTPQAQEAGAFSIHLTGRQMLDPARPVDLALFQPLDATSGGGRIAVLAPRNLTLDVRDDGSSGAFGRDHQEPPADWPWPSPSPGGRPSDTSAIPPTLALWLRHDGRPPALPLLLTVHNRAVTYRTNLSVQVDRRWLSIEQETEYTISFGSLDHVDVAVPAPLQGHWELESGDVRRRSDLGGTAAGDLLVRLDLGKEVSDRLRLKFRIRRPLSPRPGPERPLAVEVPWLRPVEGRALPIQVRVASESGVDLEPRGVGWTRLVDDEAVAASSVEGAQRLRFLLVSDSPESTPLTLVATAQPVATLPPLVASRLWIRTIQGPHYDLQTTAVYLVESHPATIAVALPAGAEWVRARIGDTMVRHVEQLPRSAGYRLTFPDRGEPGAGAGPAPGPVAVTLEYTLAAAVAQGPLGAPRLLEGGLVQETLWEVRVPWGRAVVGVPPGWSDENTWVWDRFRFRRKPWQTAADLAAWALGSKGEGAGVEGAEDPAREEQAFLFGRPGPPVELRVRVVSRGWLIGVCSGSALAVGAFLVLFVRPARRLACVAVLALVLAVATLAEPGATFLAIQSALIGLVLTLLTALMQRLVHRPGHGRVFGESSSLTGSSPGGSTVVRPLGTGAGSDDSTEIRVRTRSTTREHPVAGTPSTSDREGAGGRSPQVE